MLIKDHTAIRDSRVHSLVSPRHMDHKGLRVTKNAYKQFLLVTLCDKTTVIGSVTGQTGCHDNKEGQK